MKILHFANNIIPFFNDYIQHDKPSFMSRIGGSDFEIVNQYLKDKTCINDKNWVAYAESRVRELNGYFDANHDKECFRLYLEKMLQCYANSDLVSYGGKIAGSFEKFVTGQTKNLKSKLLPLIEYSTKNKTIINWNAFIEDIIPFQQSLLTWGTGKKILIVSPFSKSIEYQFQFKDKLFLDYQYPDFQLLTYNTKITYSTGNDTKESLNIDTDNWHQECEKMSNDIEKLDFDIALLSCGSYSMFLGDFIKTRMNKKAIYMGGTINLFFNIYGKRYEPFYSKVGCDPKFQIEAFENAEIESLRGGRKFHNESLNAYFGFKDEKLH